MTEEPRDDERFPDPPSDEEIERRLREVREGLSAHQIPEQSDEEIDERTREIQSRIDAARQRSFPEPPDLSFNRPSKLESDASGYRGLGVGMSVAYSLLGSVAVGWGIGKLIDMQTGGVMGQAIGTLIGAIGGLAASVMMIIRTGEKDR